MPSVPDYPGALPKRSQSQDIFSTNVDEFVTWLTGVFIAAINDFGEAMVSDYAAANYNATSTTSLAIGSGAKAFVVGTGKLFVPGQFVIAASAANVANYMSGQVTSYAGGTLTLNVSKAGGGGTHADWRLTLSGPEGAVGPVAGAGTFLELAGGTMTGPLAAKASAAAGAGLNLPQGAAPTTPVNGDIWTTASGVFARIAGATLALLSKAGGVMTGALGLTADSTVQDAAGTAHAIGFLGVPLDVQAGSLTLELKHAGAGVKSTNTGAAFITIPAAATVAFPANETVIPIVNRGTTGLNISPAAGVTLYLAGTGTTGARTLARYGIATLIKTGTDEWMISGAGVA